MPLLCFRIFLAPRNTAEKKDRQCSDLMKRQVRYGKLSIQKQRRKGVMCCDENKPG